MADIFEKLVVRCYCYWNRHKLLLISLLVPVIAAAGYFCSRIELSNDVKSMLPDGKDGLIEDFDLLSYAPMSKNVLISLESSQPDVARLTSIADSLSVELRNEYFSEVVAGISQEDKIKLFNWYFDHVSSLSNSYDLAAIREKLQPSALESCMQDNLRLLHSPDSLFMKNMVRKDPLGLRGVIAGKFQNVNAVGSINPESDYFLKPDNKQLLIIADTTVSISDYKRSRDMLEFLNGKLAETVPDDIKFRVICGHRYTVANSETIQSDLKKVLIISSTGLLAVFIIFLRHWTALLIYLVPLLSMVSGLLMCSIIFDKVSAITLGFGAVLLGISADFGLHLFYGMQNKDREPEEKLRALVKPLVYCALTTASVFVVLLFSSMPTQRQLAVFSITGITTALFLALFVLPHIIPGRQVVFMKPLPVLKPGMKTALLWVIVLAICIIPAFKVGFDGDIRNISMRPDDIVEDESYIRANWGGVRDRAMFFVFGSDIEQALSQNDTLYKEYISNKTQGEILNISPVLPSVRTQQSNILQWQELWNSLGGVSSVKKTIDQCAAKYGFGESAFDPFYEMLDNDHQTFALEDLEKLGISKMVLPFVAKIGPDKTAVISMFPDDDNELSAAKNILSDSKIISNQNIGNKLSQATSRDFIRFFCISVGVILLLIVILFGNKAMIFPACLPVIFGLVIMFGIMGITGINYNIFNVVASILVIGLAVDYGIFVVFGSIRDVSLETGYAVTVSGITTLIGFGSLIFAKHPSMFSIGITVSSGIVPALLCSITLVPYVVKKLITQQEK